MEVRGAAGAVAGGGGEVHIECEFRVEEEGGGFGGEAGGGDGADAAEGVPFCVCGGRGVSGGGVGGGGRGADRRGRRG